MKKKETELRLLKYRMTVITTNLTEKKKKNYNVASRICEELLGFSNKNYNPFESGKRT